MRQPSLLLLILCIHPLQALVPLRAPLSLHRRLAPNSSNQKTARRLPIVRMTDTTSDSSASSSDDDNNSEKTTISRTSQTLHIALPAMIGMLSDPLLSLMDTGYVGHLGTLPLAALGTCTSLFHLAFHAFRATTAATTSLVAAAVSDEEQARRVVGISLQLGVVVGVGVAATLGMGGNWALARMGIATSSKLYPYAADYLFTRCWAAPVVLLIGVAEGAFRGYGNTVVPLLASAAAALINLVLDPLLMFKPVGWGVRGAAAATALSQVGAALVYARKLLPLLPQPTDAKATPQQARQVITTILTANAAMIVKQGSLLLGWAYATARATFLGPSHVAAHQVALSFWLVFALLLDGVAVAAQVLQSKAYAKKDTKEIVSWMKYMIGLALAQGLCNMFLVDALDFVLPQLFTPDPLIQQHLHNLMPHLAWQQVLVSLTLVLESLAVGCQQFQSLAVGTALATLASVYQLSKQTTVEGIWGVGIVTLFGGRLLFAVVANVRALRRLKKEERGAS